MLRKTSAGQSGRQREREMGKTLRGSIRVRFLKSTSTQKWVLLIVCSPGCLSFAVQVDGCAV